MDIQTSGIFSEPHLDLVVASVTASATLLALLLWLFGFGQMNCACLFICSVISIAFNSVEPFLLVVIFVAMKLAIGSSARLTQNPIYLSRHPHGFSVLGHWSVLIEETALPRRQMSRVHVVNQDNAEGVSFGCGRLTRTQIQEFDDTLEEMTFVGWARQDWPQHYEQLRNEIQPEGRWVDNCQDYAVSIAYHLSAFRIWTLILAFREVRRGRTIFAYSTTLGLSLGLYYTTRYWPGTLTQTLSNAALALNPVTCFLLLLGFEVERLRMGTATRDVNNWSFNWATWKRTWTKEKTLGFAGCIVGYISLRSRIYTNILPVDVLIISSVIAAMSTWIRASKDFQVLSKPKVFTSQRGSLFGPKSMSGYAARSGVVRPRSYESFKLNSRILADEPVGFDESDICMASQIDKPDQKELEVFLSTKEDNAEYQIGVAFVGKAKHQGRIGHAAVILREYNLDTLPRPETFQKHQILTELKGAIFHSSATHLNVLHLRHDEYSPGLVLAFEMKQKVKYYRFADLYRVRINRRLLKHLALLSCPEEHRVLISDCATFAYNFLVNVLGHLHNEGEIDDATFKKQRELLAQRVHIADGSVGASEASSRQQPVSGEIGHASIALMINSAG